MIVHSEKWVTARGDPNEWAIGITKATFERIMKAGGKHRADALALYLFYAYTKRWQSSSEIWATIQYAAEGLGWGVSKVLAVKKILVALGLIENVMVRDRNGRVTKQGWRVRVNYVVGRWHHDEGLVDEGADQMLISPHLVKTTPKEDILLPEKRRLLASNDQIEQVWKIYPRRAGKPAAIAAIKRAIKRAGYDKILAATKAFAAARPSKDDPFTPWPQKFFNQERYNDDPSTWAPPTAAERKMSAFEIEKRMKAISDEIDRLWKANRRFVKGSSEKMEVPEDIRRQIDQLKARRADYKRLLAA